MSIVPPELASAVVPKILAIDPRLSTLIGLESPVGITGDDVWNLMMATYLTGYGDGVARDETDGILAWALAQTP